MFLSEHEILVAVSWSCMEALRARGFLPRFWALQGTSPPWETRAGSEARKISAHHHLAETEHFLT